MKIINTSTCLCMIAILAASCTVHEFTIDTLNPGAEIQPTMYGVFFEDINYAADGGMYAEMVENRSFDAPQALQGWDCMGNVHIGTAKPAFSRNPGYACLRFTGNYNLRTGLYNRGYFGMGIREGAGYDFSVYARKADGSTGPARIKVEIVDPMDNVIAGASIEAVSADWTKYEAKLTAGKGEADARLRILLEGKEGIDIDHVSLFPQDNWNGLRPDLVQDLADLNPGILRFPGGCIVEGSTLETRYQWKNSVGPVENRPLNINRWNNSYDAKFAPMYHQSYGIGFYEYFMLAEKIGAEPVPILSVGIACQFHNHEMGDHASVGELGPFIQDAIDLIEFANGGTDTEWGSLRAQMGHPEPFNLKYLGIGNEQWGTLFPERLEPFAAAVRASHPEIMIIGSAGPGPYGGDFDYLWKEMERLGADLVDEHYYMSPTWFLSNARRYDNYDRSMPKVFAGEYAAHVRNWSSDEEVRLVEFPAPGSSGFEGTDGLGSFQMGSQPVLEGTEPVSTGLSVELEYDSDESAPFYKNNFLAALCEAAFMTGLERNADVVHMSAYAPLFAHAKGYQWDPDLIWFDNLSSVRTPSYYVQQMYGQNAGTNVLSMLENGRSAAGEDGLYATACFDRESGSYIVKIANAGTESRRAAFVFEGVGRLGKGTVTSLHGEDRDYNSLENKDVVVPSVREIRVMGNTLRTVIPARTFQVYRF